MGAEVLTRLIKREQSKGVLTGLPFDGGASHLAHLLYADDCLLVARALTAKVGR